jgi:hypothetical protein
MCFFVHTDRQTFFYVKIKIMTIIHRKHEILSSGFMLKYSLDF